MFAAEIIAVERRNERISASITVAVLVILILLSVLWKAIRYNVPPPGEGDNFQTVAAMDFGDYTQGSKNINNFDPPVENPTTTRQAPSQPQPTTPVKQTDPPIISTPEPSPVTVPSKPAEKPKPQPTTTPTPPTPKPNTTPATQPSKELEYKPGTGAGGSNQGNAPSGTGNSGSPDAKTLDPSGLYSFGDGSGGGNGLKGRGARSLGYPSYTVQEEGTLKFEFVILPNGTVGNAKLVGVTDKSGIREAGLRAIRGWKFDPLPPGQTTPQTVQVTIKFRLK